MSRGRGLWLLLVLIGCGPGYDEEFVEGLRHVTARVKSGGDGSAMVKLDINPGETAFLATTMSTGGITTHHRELRSPRPDPDTLFDALEEAELDQSKTNAGFISSAATLNWPILDSDLAVDEGRWFLDVGVVEGDEYVRDEATVEVLVKDDADFTVGTLQANIVYAGDTHLSAELVNAVEGAITRWQALYRTIGIEVEVETHTWENGDLGAPAFGTPEDFEGISAMTRLRSINVVIAPTIEDLDDVYGISGDIPGPLVSTGRSAVLISSLLAAGTDGEFSPTEVRLLSETFAHETGHYLGLYHPVETEYDHWDALEDTNDCKTESRCISKLSSNLMFPFPVCGFSLDSCTPQTSITDQQAIVVNHSVAVD